jgi:hypothetical protein
MSAYVGPQSWLRQYFILAFRIPVIQTGETAILAVVLSKN